MSSSPITPIMLPDTIICLVCSIPVLTAIALGGVDIGSTIAKLADKATTNPSIIMPATPSTIPDVANEIASGMSSDAVTVLDKKLDMTSATIPNSANNTRYPN